MNASMAKRSPQASQSSIQLSHHSPFEGLLRQMETSRSASSSSSPGRRAHMPGRFSIVGLTRALDPLPEELIRERRRRNRPKAWPEHVKHAILENRVESG